jgi:hypothetical protein
VLGGHGGAVLERVEDDQALEVGDGRCKPGLQPGFSSAPETGFAHTEVLEMIGRVDHAARCQLALVLFRMVSLRTRRASFPAAGSPVMFRSCDSFSVDEVVAVAADHE